MAVPPGMIAMGAHLASRALSAAMPTRPMSNFLEALRPLGQAIYDKLAGQVRGGGYAAPSPTYGWEGIRTTADPNSPIPVVYGTHRVGGNIVYALTERYGQMERKWSTVTLTQISASGKVCVVRTASEVDTLVLTVNRYLLGYDVGASEVGGIASFEESPISVMPYKAKFTTSAGTTLYAAAYKIELKKHDDADYTTYEPIYAAPDPDGKIGIYGLRTQAGESYDLEMDQWDVRLTAPGWDGIPDATYYATACKGRVAGEPAHTGGEMQVLHCLVALGEGEIDDVGDIQVGGSRLAGLTSSEWGPVPRIRHGTNSQSKVPLFTERSAAVSAGVADMPNYEDEAIYETSLSNVTSVVLHFTYPDGQYRVVTGGLAYFEVEFTVEYSRFLDPDWDSYTQSGGTKMHVDRDASARHHHLEINLPQAGKYRIKITRTSQSESPPNLVGNLRLEEVEEKPDEGYTHPNTALVGLAMIATSQLSGGTPEFSAVVRGARVSQPKICLTGAPYTELDYDEYYVDGGGNYKRLSDDAAAEWSGAQWVTKWTANPVWCIRDLLLNSRYGLGDYVASSNLDDTAWETAAKFCDELVNIENGRGQEKRFRLDVVIDSLARAFDLITGLAAGFRAAPLWSQGTARLIIDKLTDVSHVFSDGNIVKGSAVENFNPIGREPNLIQFTILDASTDYESNSVEVADEATVDSGTTVSKSVRLLGCSRRTQATRLARYIINCGKYCLRSIALRSGVDALGVEPGDVVAFQHNLVDWGFGGRLLAGCTTTRLILGREITLEAGTNKIKTVLTDGTVEESTVSEGAGTYSILTVSPAFSSAPPAFSPFLVGLESKVDKEFRVVSMEWNPGRLEAIVRATEYNTSVYTTTGDLVDRTTPDHREMKMLSVEHLQAKETSFPGQSGKTIIHGLQVSWRLPDVAITKTEYNWLKAAVYVSDPQSDPADLPNAVLKKSGETRAGSHFIPMTRSGHVRVKVTSFNLRGEEESLDDANSVDVELTASNPGGDPTAYYEEIGETPTGTINGSNAIFTLSYAVVPGTLKLYLNGLYMIEGTDYSLDPTDLLTITYVAAKIPVTGRLHYAHYLKA